jgi:hypothetical protein
MSEEPSAPELPDWIGKLLAIIAILIVLMAVYSAVVVLLPRLGIF